MMAYRADIDGLRALAILPVLLFHAGLDVFGGGFVGVDVFFVISGYLITLILVPVSGPALPIVQFYERRVRRIVPALFVVAVAACVAAWIWLQPDQMLAFASTLVLLPLFASNIRMWKQSGYFDAGAETIPLLHTWSLAVEEQFYALFPLLIWLVRRHGSGRYAIWFSLIAFASLLASIYGAQYHPALAFYSAHTRGFELLLGALVAVGIAPQISQRASREIIGIGALLLVIVPVFAYGKGTPFPGLAALAPTLGAALLIHAGGSGASLVKQALSSRPLVLIGRISYPLYLWHWPLLVFAGIASPLPLGPVAKGVVLLLAAVLAALTAVWVETPLRRRLVLPRPHQIMWAGLACGVGLGLFGLAASAGHGWPQRIPLAIRAQVLANSALRAEIALPVACRRNFRRILQARDAIFECPIGASGARTMLFWGDSQIEQLYPLLADLARDGTMPDHRITAVTSGGCPPVPGLNSVAAGFDCDGFNQRALARALQPDVDIVVLASAPYAAANLCRTGGPCQPFGDRAAYEAAVAENFSAQLRHLADAGKTIVVIQPFPSWPVAIPGYLNRMLALGLEPSLALTREQHLKQTLGFASALRTGATASGAQIVDPSEVLCASGACVYQRGHVSLYSDASHLGPEAARSLRGLLVAALLRAAAQSAGKADPALQ